MKVTRLTTVWVKDEFREICFFGIMEFTYIPNDKVEADVSEDVSELKELLDRPYSQLELDLLGKWENIKSAKLHDLD
jgi:hypothetical protein